MNETSIFYNKNLNDLEVLLREEFKKFEHLNNFCYIASEDFYWNNKLYDTSLYNLSKFKPLRSHFAIYNKKPLDILHFTSKSNLEKILNEGYLLAGDSDKLSIGKGIYCFIIGQGRSFGKTETKESLAVLYGTVDVPYLRIIDYCDNTLKPIGEHILLVDKLPLDGLKYSCDSNFIESLIYSEDSMNKVQTLELYGLNYDKVKDILFSESSTDINKLTNKTFKDSIPEILTAMR